MSSKPKPNSFTKALRLQRFFSNDLNDFSIAFGQQRQNSPAAFNFFLLFEADDADFRQQISLKLNSRRQISYESISFELKIVFCRQTNGAISTKKALYHSSFDPSSQLFINIDNITVITSKQLQRIINIAINNYVQRYSPTFELVEFPKPAELLEPQKEDEADYDVADNAEIFR